VQVSILHKKSVLLYWQSSLLPALVSRYRICSQISKRQGGNMTAKSRSRQVFQICYDEGLLITRAELLKRRGYSVLSALGNDEAKRTIDKGAIYHLFIVGHAAKKKTRQEMVNWLKANFPGPKILALNPPDEMNVNGADYNILLNGPEEWLAAVTSAIG
jgi:hypothetical protein